MRYLALFLAGGLIAGPVPAQELQGNTIVLTAEQAAHCRAVGCHILPADQLQAGLEQVMRRAYEAGVASCKQRI